MKRLISLSVVLAFGCSTSSKDIAPVYVSPLQYQAFTCEQLAAESVRIQTRVTQLGGRLDEAASNDKTITGVGIVLFWPALFFLGGTKQQEAEYARLRGEYDAAQQAGVQKNCPGLVAPTAPTQQATQPAPQPATQGATAPVPQPAQSVVETTHQPFPQ
jgi:hypothetical protein